MNEIHSLCKDEKWKDVFWKAMYIRLFALSIFAFPQIPMFYKILIVTLVDTLDNAGLKLLGGHRPDKSCQWYYQYYDKMMDLVWYSVVMLITYTSGMWFTPILFAFFMFKVFAFYTWSNTKIDGQGATEWDRQLGIFFDASLVFYFFQLFAPKVSHVIQVGVLGIVFVIKLMVCKNYSKAYCH